jgi:hypothetical protein
MQFMTCAPALAMAADVAAAEAVTCSGMIGTSIFVAFASGKIGKFERAVMPK